MALSTSPCSPQSLGKATDSEAAGLGRADSTGQGTDVGKPEQAPPITPSSGLHTLPGFLGLFDEVAKRATPNSHDPVFALVS